MRWYVAAVGSGIDDLLQDACRRALRYLADLADRPVAPPSSAVLALRELDFPLPAAGRDPAEVLALLDEIGSPATVVSVANLIGRTCRLARRFAAGMREAGFAVLNDVVLNQVVVDFGDPSRTRSVIAAIQAEGTCWCGPTTWHARPAMRVSISNWTTTPTDIDQAL
jgi:hypothetical protein